MTKDMTNEDDNAVEWKRAIVSPIDVILGLIGIGIVSGIKDVPDFITFDPDTIGQFKRREQSSHDGTHLFSYELEASHLAPILLQDSFFKPEPRPSDNHYPHYFVGNITRLVSYQRITVPAGIISGQVERLIMPVRVEWRL